MAKDDTGKRGKRQKKQQHAAAEDAPGMAPDALPDRLRDQHQFVTCGPDLNLHANTVTSAHAYMYQDVDNAWSFDHFARNFSVSLNSAAADGNDIEFDVKGVDPAIMNAVRRILISEVPTVAIEHVFFLNNTSIIADEMLAHRLGLVPLNIDPRKLKMRQRDTVGTEHDTVVFKLDVTCRRINGMKDPATGRMVGGELENEKVMAEQLQYLPGGSEIPEETNCHFGEDQQMALDLDADIRPVLEDILLAKMRPGQSIELEAHCTKGIGMDHAKWSPVATAWYRLNPEVVLLKDITGERADELLDLCKPSSSEPEGYEPLFSVEGSGSARKLAVVKTRGNEHHLEKLRKLSGEPEWEDSLQVRKDKEHFIFTVQSTGVLPPAVLWEQAVDVLSEKCDKLLQNLP